MLLSIVFNNQIEKLNLLKKKKTENLIRKRVPKHSISGIRAFTSGLLYAICWYILASKHKNNPLPGLAKSWNSKKICNCALVPS